MSQGEGWCWGAMLWLWGVWWVPRDRGRGDQGCPGMREGCPGPLSRGPWGHQGVRDRCPELGTGGLRVRGTQGWGWVPRTRDRGTRDRCPGWGLGNNG